MCQRNRMTSSTDSNESGTDLFPHPSFSCCMILDRESKLACKVSWKDWLNPEMPHFLKGVLTRIWIMLNEVETIKQESTNQPNVSKRNSCSSIQHILTSVPEKQIRNCPVKTPRNPIPNACLNGWYRSWIRKEYISKPFDLNKVGDRFVSYHNTFLFILRNKYTKSYLRMNNKMLGHFCSPN